jgi:arylsulfatase A-like enzyme
MSAGSWLLAPARRRLVPLGAGSLGALYLLLASALAASGPIVDADEPALGGAAGVVAELVRVRYADEVARIYVTLSCAALLVGALLGTVAGLLVTLRDRVQGRPPGSRLRLAATLILLVLAAHALCLARSVATHPFAYAGALYGNGSRGGLRRWAEIAVADHFSPGAIVAIGVAAVLLFVLGAPSRWRRSVTQLLVWRRRVLGVLGALAFAAAAWAAWHRAPRVALARSGHPNVLLLAADGVRADRLGPDVTPNLARLAARGTRFDHAYTALARTFPSWTSLLTGRYPHHHGIRSTFESWDTRSKSFDALPERFAAAGYRTAVVSDFAGDIFGRIPLGFQEVRVPREDFRQLMQVRAFAHDFLLLPFLDTELGRAAFPGIGAADSLTDPHRVASDAIDELRSFGDRPFFLTVFFSTTHFPYAAPYPYDRRFTSPAYRGRFKYGRSATLAPGAAEEGVEDIRQVRALYDGAVASVDDAAGLILDELARAHTLEDTIIVVTSDHGESLFEPRRGVGHGEHLFGDEQTHIPLAIVDPRRPAPRAEPSVVSSVDLAPTLYELAGVAPPPDLDGRSLAPGMRGEPMPSVPVFSENELWFSDTAQVPSSQRIPTPTAPFSLILDEAHGDEIQVRPEVIDLTLVSRHRMIRDDRWKLVYMPTRAGVSYALFDTRGDPDESANVAAAQPAEVERLMKPLWDWMLEDPKMTKMRGYLVPRPTVMGAP